MKINKQINLIHSKLLRDVHLYKVPTNTLFISAVKDLFLFRSYRILNLRYPELETIVNAPIGYGNYLKLDVLNNDKCNINKTFYLLCNQFDTTKPTNSEYQTILYNRSLLEVYDKRLNDKIYPYPLNIDSNDISFNYDTYPIIIIDNFKNRKLNVLNAIECILLSLDKNTTLTLNMDIVKSLNNESIFLSIDYLEWFYKHLYKDVELLLNEVNEITNNNLLINIYVN